MARNSTPSIRNTVTKETINRRLLQQHPAKNCIAAFGGRHGIDARRDQTIPNL